MEELYWIVDIYPSPRTNVYRKLKKRYKLEEKDGKLGMYWITKVTDSEIKKLERLLKRKSIYYKKYKKEWSRSSDYRKQFLAAYQPPYRCRYCNRRLKTEYMEVDHLIPINQVKTKASVRRILAKDGCDDVNDIKNLVPSCHRCNRRKSDKMGIWYIKGKLGKYSWYWAVRKIAAGILLILISIAVFLVLQHFQVQRII